MQLNPLDYLWKSTELAQLLNGVWLTEPKEEWYAVNFSINEKRISEDTVFIVLDEKTEAGEEGASNQDEMLLSIQDKICGIIVQKPILSISSELPQLMVEDCYKAVEKLALSVREKIDSKIVCVTGTKYKSYTRRLIDLLLQSSGTTFMNGPANNKAVDSLLSLAACRDNPDYVVLETFYPSIRKDKGKLCNQLAPHVCVITDAGITSNDIKQAEKGVCAKLNFCKHIQSDGCVVLSREMSHYEFVVNELAKLGIKTVSYGFSEDCDVRALYYGEYEAGHIINAMVRGEKLDYYLPVYGKNMIECSLAALAVMDFLGMDLVKSEYFSAYPIVKGDRNFNKIPFKKEFLYLINDCRYKTLSSLISTLNVFKDLKIDKDANKIAVLGDITISDQQTAEQLIEALESFGFKTVFLYGKEMEKIYQLLPEHFKKDIFYKEQKFIDGVLDEVKENDLVFFKGANIEKMPEMVTGVLRKSNKFKVNALWITLLIVILLIARLLRKF